MQHKICMLYFFAIISALTSTVITTHEGSDQQRFVFASSGISFTTFTVLKVTTTTTSTMTSITTCTTSTAILSSCTTGRRRRGLIYDEGDRHRRAGLFYNEDAQNNDGNTFLPSEKKSSNPILEVVNSSVDESSVVPLEIESGFSLPKGSPDRFLLSFGTSTITSLIISYSTVSLTAICSSTSGFPLCGGVGK